MSATTRLRTTVRTVRTASTVAALVVVGVAGQVLVAGSADAAGATTVSKVELNGTQLRLEGSTSGAGFVEVDSTTSSAGGYAGQNFAFKIEGTGFTAPTCRVVVRGINAPDLSVDIPNCTPNAT